MTTSLLQYSAIIWSFYFRAGQMIVSNSLISLHLGRNWRWKCDEKRPVFTADDIQVILFNYIALVTSTAEKMSQTLQIE